MIRVLRHGDRVKIDGVYEGTDAGGWARVSVDTPDSGTTVVVPAGAVIFVATAEPPVGSVVVKDGASFIREVGSDGSARWWSPKALVWRRWDDISNGKIVFTPGGSE